MAQLEFARDVVKNNLLTLQRSNPGPLTHQLKASLQIGSSGQFITKLLLATQNSLQYNK